MSDISLSLIHVSIEGPDLQFIVVKRIQRFTFSGARFIYFTINSNFILNKIPMKSDFRHYT